jgi:ADP-ribose pyrophosphatase
MNKRPQFSGRVVTLAVEEHTLPDGRIVPFEIVRHPGGAAVLPLLDDGRVVLIRQFRPALGAMVLEIPAGRLEIGYRAGRLEKLGEMLSSVGFCDERIYLFLGRDLEAVPAAPEPDEFIEVLTLSLEEALAALHAGEIADGKTQLALLLARERLR